MKTVCLAVCLLAVSLTVANGGYVAYKPVEFPFLKVDPNTIFGNGLRTFEELVRFTFNEMYSGALKPFKIVEQMYVIATDEYETVGGKVRQLVTNLKDEIQRGAVYNFRIIGELVQIIVDSLYRMYELLPDITIPGIEGSQEDAVVPNMEIPFVDNMQPVPARN